jgi:hypothetical protein
MSERLIQIFLGDTPIHLDDQAVEGEPKLLWKVVLRTGTWKLRPGPGGVKLNSPLKIFRDKAPKGHISMSSLVKNFGAGAKENVTIPLVHADGTVSDSGFVRKLVIQDVPSEDGSGAKQSLLWAGMDITEPDIKGKVERGTLKGVSGGILFDYERTEDAKKFDQILSHVMITNTPWIGGTGGFKDKLPDGVMADEPDDLPVGELEPEGQETVALQVEPGPGSADPERKPQPTTGEVVWKPTEGFSWIKGKLQRALEENRRRLMAQFGEDAYKLEWPFYSVDDVTGDSGSRVGKALICSGYGAEKESWVAGYKIDDSEGGHDLAIIDAFQDWTPAKPEWVAASEQVVAPHPIRTSAVADTRKKDLFDRPDRTALAEAQQQRARRIGLSQTITTTPTIGGTRMGRLRDLLQGVELSDEQREAIRQEDEEVERLRAESRENRQTKREADATAFLGALSNTVFDNPGSKRVIQSLLLSDDGGPAVEYVELSETGQRTQPRAMTATEIVRKIVDSVPKTEEERMTLSGQAPRVPGEVKPPIENPDDSVVQLDLSEAAVKERADKLAKDMRDAGIELVGGGS